MDMELHTVEPLSDLLGLDLIVRIIENMNINEEQNCLDKATFNRETALLVYKSLGNQYCLLHILNHSTLSQSQPIQVFFIGYDECKCCFCSALTQKNKLAFDCTFQCYSFKKHIATDLDHD